MLEKQQRLAQTRLHDGSCNQGQRSDDALRGVRRCLDVMGIRLAQLPLSVP